MIRRFFDATAEGGAGQVDVNVAEIMAREGVKTESDIAGTVPDVTIEEKQQAEQQQGNQEEKKAETATSEKPADVQPAAEKPQTEQVPEKKTVTEPPALNDLLKAHPENDVLKALGLDDRMVNFLSHWKSGKDMKDFLEAVAVDYSKMSPEDLMRRQLWADYPELSPEDHEELYRMKVIEQYKLDPDLFSEQDVKRGKILLNADAAKIRNQFLERQQNLLLSKPEADDKVAKLQAEYQERETRAQNEFNAYKEKVTTDQQIKTFLEKKILQVGEGDEAFNFEVKEPDRYLDLIFDVEKWGNKFFNQDGSPNIKKHLLVAAVLDDDTTFLSELGNHYRKVGAKKAIEPIENASQNIGTPANDAAQMSNPVAELARAGIIISG